MDEIWIPIIIVPVLFIALPWLILHYVTKWKANSRLTSEDETMLDDLYELARRLDDRMHTIERIIQDDHPSWNSLSHDRGTRLARPDPSELANRNEDDRMATPDLVKRGRS